MNIRGESIISPLGIPKNFPYYTPNTPPFDTIVKIVKWCFENTILVHVAVCIQ